MSAHQIANVCALMEEVYNTLPSIVANLQSSTPSISSSFALQPSLPPIATTAAVAGVEGKEVEIFDQTRRHCEFVVPLTNLKQHVNCALQINFTIKIALQISIRITGRSMELGTEWK